MKNLKFYENKKIFLAPHSPMTLAFAQYLLAHNIQVQGFVDKNKQGENVRKIGDIHDAYDYIFILSPNHFDAIYLDYLPFVHKEKLLKITLKNAEYTLDENPSYSHEKEFFYHPQQMQMLREKIIFISKSFISSNNKAFYLYCLKHGQNAVMLTDNKTQIAELKTHDLPYEILTTKEAEYEIAIAKFIVFDQGNSTYLPPLHPSQKTIQLWHGVGLKKMAKMDNIVYDYFVSTSQWTNETNFQNIFNAKEFLTSGYPRNDFFFEEESALDFLFCDHDIHATILKNRHKKTILYTPTHRENNTRIPLDFELLNVFLKTIDALFIVKLHPFVLEYYTSLKEEKYSHIIFHNAHGDVYPLLKYVDILVSDYSSIVYDFLLFNKPILFFIYDKEAYIQNVPLLFDFDEYSPGLKLFTQEELMQALVAQDEHEEQRAQIKKLFFEKNKQSAAQNILDTILQNNKGLE